MEFEWNIYQDSIRCSSVKKSKVYCWDYARLHRISQDGLSSCRCSTTFLLEQKTMKKNVWQILDSYLCMQEDLEKDNGDSMVFVLKIVVLERMLLELAESGCPIFRATTPLSRSQLKKQRTWKIVDTLCSRPRNDWDYFSHDCFCKPAQSLLCSRQICERNTKLAMSQQGDLLWQDNLTHCGDQVPHSCLVRSRQKSFWIVMTQRINIFKCNNMETELRSYHNKINWVIFVWMQDFWVLLKLDNTSWRKTLHNFHNFMQWLVVNTLFQEKKKHHIQKGRIQGNTTIGPELEVAICCLHGKYGVEIRILSVNRQYSLLGQNFSWIKQVCDAIEQQWARNSRSSARRIWVKIGCERFCMPVEGQSKTTKKRICWLITENRSHWKKELDRCWTREVFFLRVRGFEESNVSSSSFTTCASRRWRSKSILENQRQSSESISTNNLLVWRSLESMLGSSRRSKKEISVLHWYFRNNCLSPSSSGTFRMQSYWSYSIGQCDYSEQFLPVLLSCRMCNQFAFYHQLWIYIWRSKFKQQTDSILSACGSYGQESKGSWYDRFECTASCTIHA